MGWSKTEELRYRAHMLWGRLKPPVIGPKCHLCKGKGIVFEGDGWAVPSWVTCTHCDGTGRPPKE